MSPKLPRVTAAERLRALHRDGAKDANRRGSVLNDYIRAALKRVVYEELEEGEGWYVGVPEFPGAWAAGKTIEETREELASVLEGWLILALRDGDTLPVLDGADLTPPLPVGRAS